MNRKKSSSKNDSSCSVDEQYLKKKNKIKSLNSKIKKQTECIKQILMILEKFKM